MTWDQLYNLLGIKDFIYFISAPQIQDYLFPVKLVFVCFSFFFLAMVIYFMVNSTWLQYKFMEDVTEFFAWQSYGSREISKKLDKIRKRIESGTEYDYKLAIIDADDLLEDVLEKRGYEGKDFADAIKKASPLLSSSSGEILAAHEFRNSIVYNPNIQVSEEQVKRMLESYESAIRSIGLS